MKKTLFWLWTAFIIFIVVFKVYDSPIERAEYLKELREAGFDNVNVHLFHTIRICADNITSRWAIKNVAGNTLPFLILGILTKNAWRDYNIKAVLRAVSSSIILFEIMQYILLLGTCDIDDALLNLTFLKIGFCLLK